VTRRARYDGPMPPIPHDFRNKALCDLALTHSSAGSAANNERLEFLGDAVLDLIVAEELFHHHEDLPEGELTELKAWVVSRRSLAEAARRLELEGLARVGRGLEGRTLSRSVLANLYEALLGAVYLDSGMDAAKLFTLATLETQLTEVREKSHGVNAKQAFQELCQRAGGAPPRYRLLDTRGQAHARAFLIAAETDGRFLSWDLAWKGDAPILYFLPHALYEAKLPKAKSVVAWPQARFDGKMIVGEREVEVAGWPGSQNHNWGSKHTDTYAWGQVVGFDGAPDTFFEAITAQVKLGPFKTPWLTVIAVRHEGKEYLLNTIGVARKAKAEWRFFEWDLENENADIHVRARITANKADFVGLDYRNPPGGSHTCLNSKIARCELTLTPKGGSPVTLKSRHRAAFEILTDDPSHGVPVVV